MYKSAFFLIQPNTDSNVVVKPINFIDYNIIYKASDDLQQLLLTLNKLVDATKYKLPMNIDHSNPDYELRMSNYAGNLDLGIHLNPSFLSGNKIGLSKKFITIYGISLSKNITNNFAIKINMGFSFKLPSTKALQTEMQSEVMAAIQSGKNTLFIDKTINGHILLGGDISVRHYFNKTNPFRPFLSAGIGMYSLTKMSGKIQDTLDLSGIDMSNPSSIQNQFNGGSTSSPSMNPKKTQFFVPQFEVGFEYRLAPAAKFNFSIPFNFFNENTSDGLKTLAWSPSFGLSFTLNSKKHLKSKKKAK